MNDNRAGSVDALIALSGVSLSRGDRPVLQDITIHSDARRIGIVGRNGSGKTTLARVLCGLAAADSGKARICNVDVAKDRRAALSVVGILFQNPDHHIIFPTVSEELTFGLIQMGQPEPQAKACVHTVLTDFGKAHWAEAATHTLSHGQKQLVCLMAIIAMAPRVVILDEPFSGLDLVTRMQLTAFLSRVDASVIHITHDPEVVRDYEEVIWLDKGRVVECGAPGPVLDAYIARMTELGTGDDLSDLSG